MSVTSESIGRLIHDARVARGWSQQRLAAEIGTAQSAIHRIENGQQNLSLIMIERLATALEQPLIQAATRGSMNYKVQGPTTLTGAIQVRSSKNAAVALLCASLLNKGTTTLRGIARIEEVDRIIEVLTSIGVQLTWANDDRDLVIRRPEQLLPKNMDQRAAKRTRSILMFLGPLMHEFSGFELPYAGGCNLGARTVHPHMAALSKLGLSVVATDGEYHATVAKDGLPEHHVTLIERGDTVTENVLMSAARTKGTTVIRNASGNYMVQDLCFFLQALGVGIEGVGTTTLKISGVEEIDVDVEYHISEDPIEAMSLLTAGIVTKSEMTVQRCPIEFLEVELAVLDEMGQRLETSPEYLSSNGKTRLVDITLHPSELHAPMDKIHPMPFPGLNIDNLPFFAVICAAAEGQSRIYDWVYDSRAIHLEKLSQLGANIQLMDAHRLLVIGPTDWRARTIETPPALRPAVCLFLAALAARGTTRLKDVYIINRGYEDLPQRLNKLGAKVEVFWGDDEEED
ncbi:UDP-N-acetylglucosamine 1-carboxyvinyltransferase [Tessaracoccus sp. OH4464_COT-324]|uniref:helix-turn-helix domain-containing protein n=1 Tax=Tessaracoccus sp. OH4464_COT-324 TaxID=2491059 RepID=UPI000F632832|nr:UDP-N-acetylglucosamine 1-carboxyvinyltransferase [Tessaracoccus sp. OH4464_COT-324]RRD48009.1 UDP-N-acetylglucosamine 1-carboxyvinyltransferase [Tessaracoccus sp. OH4464_COT-324]